MARATSVGVINGSNPVLVLAFARVVQGGMKEGAPSKSRAGHSQGDASNPCVNKDLGVNVGSSPTPGTIDWN